MAKKTVKKTTTIVEEIVEGAEKTQIVCILDSSTSMSTIIKEAIGGFNDFIKKQKKLEGDATITVALFDSAPNYQILIDNKDLKKVEEITEKDWSPRGMTALYDGIGKTIKHVESVNRELPVSQRPDKTLVAIVTDGEENNSREFNKSSVKELIEAKEKEGWQFVYLAADQNAFAAGTSIGISGGNTLRYKNSGMGNTVVFDTLNFATEMYRGISTQDANYSTLTSNIMATASNGAGEVGESFITTTGTANLSSLTVSVDQDQKSLADAKDKKKKKDS